MQYRYQTFGPNFEYDDDFVDSLMALNKDVFPETYYDTSTMLYCLEMSNYIELCYYNDKLIGMIGCFHNNPYYDIKDELCYIYTFGVLEAHRNKGIGTKLFTGVLKYANDLNKPGVVTLDVYKNSENVIKFYKKHGFVIAEQYDYDDQHFMSLEL